MITFDNLTDDEKIRFAEYAFGIGQTTKYFCIENEVRNYLKSRPNKYPDYDDEDVERIAEYIHFKYDYNKIIQIVADKYFMDK